MMIKQGFFEAFLLLALSSRWCDADGLHGLLRKGHPENLNVRARSQGTDDSNAGGDLTDNNEISSFWENRLLMIQSVSTLHPTTAPSSEPSSQPSTLPTASPSSFPSPSPTVTPSATPTAAPSALPTASPVDIVFTLSPTASPVDAVVTPAPTAPLTFAGVLSLQATTGVCSSGTNQPGCGEATPGVASNPSDAVNCFDVKDVGGRAPFSLDSVRFWIGTAFDLTSDLSIRVWSSFGGGPGNLLREQSLTGYTKGLNRFDLSTPAEITSDEFCVGLFSIDATGGLFIQSEETGTFVGLASFVLAPNCAIDVFTPLFTLVPHYENFCIEAFVSTR